MCFFHVALPTHEVIFLVVILSIQNSYLLVKYKLLVCNWSHHNIDCWDINTLLFYSSFNCLFTFPSSVSFVSFFTFRFTSFILFSLVQNGTNRSRLGYGKGVWQSFQAWNDCHSKLEWHDMICAIWGVGEGWNDCHLGAVGERRMEIIPGLEHFISISLEMDMFRPIPYF